MRNIFFLFSLFFVSTTFAEQLIIEPDAGRAPLLNAIKDAKSSIDIAMYGFTDQTLINALIDAKHRGKNINLLLEPTPYKSEDENNRAIRLLQSEEIKLQYPDKSFKLLHQKTFILDHQTAIVMTFNLTHSSFSRQRNFALIITDPTEVQEINQVFTADWAHENVKVSHPNLVWSPDNSREKIINLIQTARSEIKIYAQDVTDYKIIGALAKVARAGVNVKILCSLSPQKLPNKKMDSLKKAGVDIHNNRHFYIHAKVMLIDHHTAMLGSINFTKPSLDNNRELSIITQETEIINQLNNIFDRDWRSADAMPQAKNQAWPTKHMLHELNRFYYHARRAISF